MKWKGDTITPRSNDTPSFGHQRRSYVFGPKNFVKDDKTGTIVNDVDTVLDGDLDKFMTDALILKQKKN
jgi:protein subunit release factor B